MKPWLWLPPKLAHDLSPWGLKLYSTFSSSFDATWKPFSWRGIYFKNRLGLAGGVDKGADLLDCWEKIGCGFVEAGTVTLRPQKANSGQILGRSIEDLALWNRMGFPSYGVEEFYFNLRDYKNHSSLPVFANIGKNRTTSNNEAFLDYIELMQRLENISDCFVLNISSPNTKGLRQLAEPSYLKDFLAPIMQARAQMGSSKPLLLKLSPDLSEADLLKILETSCEQDIDGFVLTNTTLSRTTQKEFPAEGGISGLPLKKLSREALKVSADFLKTAGYTQGQKKKLLVSVGGVMTAREVFERIELGADLVQVYSALIFHGPFFFKTVYKEACGKQEK